MGCINNFLVQTLLLTSSNYPENFSFLTRKTPELVNFYFFSITLEKYCKTDISRTLDPFELKFGTHIKVNQTLPVRKLQTCNCKTNHSKN